MKSLAIVALVLALAPAARADGIFVWRLQDQDIREPQQKAFIIHDQGWEDLVLSVKYEGAAADFGWIVPLPAKPEMEAVDGAIFEALSKATQSPRFGRSRSETYLSLAVDAAVAPTVTTARVGIYDIAILEGGNAAGVQAWLTANTFVLPEGAEPTLAGYLQGGWVFAAMRIAPEERTAAVADSLAAASTQPVHFRFPAAEPVFPLKISSLGGHESEILLYVLSRKGLVPKLGPGMSWESHVWSPVSWGWFQYHGLGHDGSPFLQRIHDRYAACQDSLVLTKSRAVVQPADMQDVTFHPYPFEEFLCGGDVRQRAEAATFIGFMNPPGSSAVLAGFLAGMSVPADPWGDGAAMEGPDDISPQQDVRSALWAIGKVGRPESVSSLSAWASGDNLSCQIQALAALQALDPRAAADICLEQLLRHGPRYGAGSSTLDAFIDQCADHLFVHGGADHVSGLRELRRICQEALDSVLAQRQGPKAKRPESKLARKALMIAAACGDSASCAQLAQELRQVAVPASLGWDIAHNPRRRGGGVNDYPAAMGPGMAIIHDSMRDGEIVTGMARDMDARPAVRDSLFRLVALDTTAGVDIPDDFRAVLLAKVAEPKPADEQMLLDIWDRAWARRGEGQDRPPTTLEEAASVEWMGQALTAAYALGAQGRCAALDRLWQATGWDEPIIKGELALAATLTGDAAAVPLVWEYVATRWAQRAQEPGFQEAVAAGLSGMGWPRECRIDEPHRARAISRFLAGFWAEGIRSMVMDTTQPPMLRLYFCWESRTAWMGHWAQNREAFQALLQDFPTGNLGAAIEKRIEQLGILIATP